MERLLILLTVFICTTASWSQDKVYEIDSYSNLFGNEIGAHFGDNFEDLEKWILANMRYPQEAIDKKEEGKVKVSFVVEKDGTLSSIEIKNSVSPSLDAEAVRLASTMPKWECAYYYGVPCRSRNQFSVNFKLPKETQKQQSKTENSLSNSQSTNNKLLTVQTENVRYLFLIHDEGLKVYLKLDSNGKVYFSYEGSLFGKQYNKNEYSYYGTWEEQTNNNRRRYVRVKYDNYRGDKFITLKFPDLPRQNYGSLNLWLDGSKEVRCANTQRYLTFDEIDISAAKPQVNQTLSPVIQNLINNMIPVFGGTFIMGTTLSKEEGGYYWNYERPQHDVTLYSFNIGRYEVTQAEWEEIMGNNPSNFKGKNLPVEKVSWDDCQLFITRLNAITGMRFRLPTEAEWEYAARGGDKSHNYIYAGSNDVNSVAWYESNNERKTHPVGMKYPNELGLYDMSGNVFEWCSDWAGWYSSESQTNPKGKSTGTDRIVRGGSWYNSIEDCRVFARNNYLPTRQLSTVGFRLVLDY